MAQIASNITYGYDYSFVDSTKSCCRRFGSVRSQLSHEHLGLNRKNELYMLYCKTPRGTRVIFAVCVESVQYYCCVSVKDHEVCESCELYREDRTK